MSGEELAPTFANTGQLAHHNLGCRCWPHVSERDALDAIAAVGLAEYRDGRAALAAPSTPEPSGWEAYKDAFPAGRNIVESERAAPSTEPALDVGLLTDALASFLTERGQYRGITPEKVAAEYARLAESQP